MKQTSVHTFCLLLGSLVPTAMPAAGSGAFTIAEPLMMVQDLDENSESLKRDLAERAEDLYRRRILVDMRGQAKEAVDILQQFKEVRSGYLSVRDSLFDSGVGKRIAADEAAFLSFRSQLTPPVATTVELDTKIERAERFETQLEVEVDAPSPYRSVTGAERDELAALKFWASESLADAQARASLLRSLVADVAKNPIDGELASLPTLRGALESYDAKLATINATAAEPIEAWAIRAAAVQRALGEAIQRRERVEHELARANIEAEVTQRVERAEAERKLARAEQQLAELQADVEREKQVSNAELQRKVKELEQDLLDRDSELRLEVERRKQLRVANTDEPEAKLRAELAAKDTEIQNIRVESALRVAEAERKLRLAQSQLALRKLPSDTKTMLGGLTALGMWKPVMVPGGMATKVTYEGSRMVKHSYQTIASTGALEDTVLGAYTLYLILAGPMDTERPRYAPKYGIHIPQGLGNQYPAECNKRIAETEVWKDEATYEKLKKVQAFLRDWGPELIANGELRK